MKRQIVITGLAILSGLAVYQYGSDDIGRLWPLGSERVVESSTGSANSPLFDLEKERGEEFDSESKSPGVIRGSISEDHSGRGSSSSRQNSFNTESFARASADRKKLRERLSDEELANIAPPPKPKFEALEYIPPKRLEQMKRTDYRGYLNHLAQSKVGEGSHPEDSSSDEGSSEEREAFAAETTETSEEEVVSNVLKFLERDELEEIPAEDFDPSDGDDFLDDEELDEDEGEIPEGAPPVESRLEE